MSEVELSMIEVIVVGDGINVHDKLLETQLTNTYTLNGFDYYIRPSKLFKVQRNIYEALKDKLDKVKNRFMIVFLQNNHEAVDLDRITEIQIGKEKRVITTEILEVARTTDVLKDAVKDMLATTLGGKKLLFIIIVGAIVVVGILVMTGNLNIRL